MVKKNEKEKVQIVK